jgi:hypothetical protein
MEHYDLRSCFLPNLYGLQLRMYQFTQLLVTHLPELAAHLDNLGIQPTYASQWFLSFFAVSCPLPMLFRIYDVIFAEGAPETIMRVALSLMRRNQKKLLAKAEFEDVMQMLLARSLWDTYGYSADDLVQDFVGLSSVVTRDAMAELEKGFKEADIGDAAKLVPAKSQTSDLQAAASRFLGRLWGGASQTISLSVPSRRSSTISTVSIQRTASKHSISTLNSVETANTDSTSTDATTMSQYSSATDERRLSTRSVASKKANKDLELHGQIEDLLLALSGLQREHAMRMDELQVVRESRDEERRLTRRLIELLSGGSQDEEESVNEISELCDQITEKLDNEDTDKSIETSKAAAQRLTEELEQAKRDMAREAQKSRNFNNLLAEQNAEVVRLKSQLLDTRGKWQDIQKENQQLQKTVAELRQKRSSEPPGSPESDRKGGGLRELRLVRSNSNKSTKSPIISTFARRSSSLGMQSILAATENQAPAPEEALLLELVAAKTAEAVAKQEAEEAKAKLEALRKVLTGPATTSNPPTSPGFASGFPFLGPSSSSSTTSHGAPAQNPSSGSGGGWFGGGWVKRSATTNVDSR